VVAENEKIRIRDELNQATKQTSRGGIVPPPVKQIDPTQPVKRAIIRTDTNDCSFQNVLINYYEYQIENIYIAMKHNYDAILLQILDQHRSKDTFVIFWNSQDEFHPKDLPTNAIVFIDSQPEHNPESETLTDPESETLEELEIRNFTIRGVKPLPNQLRNALLRALVTSSKIFTTWADFITVTQHFMLDAGYSQEIEVRNLNKTEFINL
jgi:hypothetical protein